MLLEGGGVKMKSWSPWRRKFELGRSFPYPATSNKNHNQTRIKSKQKGHSEFKEDGICSSSNPFYNVAHSSEKLTWFHLFFLLVYLVSSLNPKIKNPYLNLETFEVRSYIGVNNTQEQKPSSTLRVFTLKTL